MTNLPQARPADLQPGSEVLLGCYCDDTAAPGLVTGRLVGQRVEVLGTGPALRNPSWLERHGDVVLACTEQQHSTLVVLSPDGDGWRVSGEQPTGGSDACHLAVSPEGEWVAVANYTSGQVSLFRAPTEGALEPALDVLQLRGQGPVADRQASSHAHQVTWLAPDVVMVCDLGADCLWLLRVADERLEQVGQVMLPAGTGPRHAVARGGGADPLQVAVAGELSGHVVSVQHTGQDWSEGWWVLDTCAGTLQPGENQPSGLRFFGDDLLLANRRIDTVALLRWADDGRLRLVAEGPCGGENPRELVEHQGQVWVANQDSCTVTRLSCAADEFTLLSTSELVTDAGPARPARVLFDPR